MRVRVNDSDGSSRIYEGISVELLPDRLPTAHIHQEEVESHGFSICIRCFEVLAAPKLPTNDLLNVADELRQVGIRWAAQRIENAIEHTTVTEWVDRARREMRNQYPETLIVNMGESSEKA